MCHEIRLSLLRIGACVDTLHCLSQQVCQQEDKTYFLKLGDFGLSTTVKSPLFRICGTPISLAPEMISQMGFVDCCVNIEITDILYISKT